MSDFHDRALGYVDTPPEEDCMDEVNRLTAMTEEMHKTITQMAARLTEAREIIESTPSKCFDLTKEQPKSIKCEWCTKARKWFEQEDWCQNFTKF